MGKLNNTPKQEKGTHESFDVYLRKSSKEFDQRMKAIQEEVRKRAEEERKWAEEDRKRAEEFDRRMEETDRLMKETSLKMEETDRRIREVSNQLGGVGNSNGDFAECYFASAFQKNPVLNGEVYTDVGYNINLPPIRGQQVGEYDIVMINGKSVAIIEVKYNLKKDYLDKALSKMFKKLEFFKTSFPKYKNYKFYLGIASMSFRKPIEKIILKEGIAVIKQVGDKMVVYDENLKVF